MTERNFKLIKNEKGNGVRKQEHRKTVQLSLLVISPAEAVEMNRFKALTRAKAARKQLVGRMVTTLEGPDDVPPAA